MRSALPGSAPALACSCCAGHPPTHAAPWQLPHLRPRGWQVWDRRWAELLLRPLHGCRRWQWRKRRSHTPGWASRRHRRHRQQVSSGGERAAGCSVAALGAGSLACSQGRESGLGRWGRQGLQLGKRRQRATVQTGSGSCSRRERDVRSSRVGQAVLGAKIAAGRGSKHARRWAACGGFKREGVRTRQGGQLIGATRSACAKLSRPLGDPAAAASLDPAPQSWPQAAARLRCALCRRPGRPPRCCCCHRARLAAGWRRPREYRAARPTGGEQAQAPLVLQGRQGRGARGAGVPPPASQGRAGVQAASKRQGAWQPIT